MISSNSKEKRPIIIVGAGRSGTKMLRGILSSHSDVVCFPREINYIWRHGNAEFPTDELTTEHARPEVAAYIRYRFETLSAKNNGRRVIEKTCANSLRVEFVNAVFPEAYIIHLVRDGRAVAESARRRWLAKPEMRYLLEKLRWVPVQDVPYYAFRFLRYQIGRVQLENGTQLSWGPRFAKLDTLTKEKSLIEVCGLQWQTCVKAASAALAQLPSKQVLTVKYENLVEDPVTISKHIFEHVQIPFLSESQTYVKNHIHPGNLDKWKQNLSSEELALLEPQIESELLKYGYQLHSQ
jgi:hypothetical protein